MVLKASFVLSQKNLVPNPGFETLNGKPKKIGQLDKASPWRSPTSGTAEIFWSGAKSEDISIPANKLGYQAAKAGDNYAGAIFYDKKNENLREYIQVELEEALDSGEVYCVEFFVNVSDLSKYSLDLIGAHLSTKQITSEKMDTIGVIPQIVNKAGRFLSDPLKWQIVCGEYKATGGEKFLTIGNFFTDKQFKVDKMKKPKDVIGSLNEYGYYFIDDVSVIEQNKNYRCDCNTKIQGPLASGMNVVYSKVSGEEEERLKPEDLIESKTIFYEMGKADFPSSDLANIKVITNVMKENTNFQLEISGYADDAELISNPSLEEQRAQKVLEYLMKSGIEKERMTRKKGSIIKTSEKADPSKFRKVDFSVIH